MDKLAVVPDPVHGPVAHVRFHILAHAERVHLRLYTQALNLVVDQDLGAVNGGWAQGDLRLPDGLPSQLYFVAVCVEQGQDRRRSPVYTLFVLR